MSEPMDLLTMLSTYVRKLKMAQQISPDAEAAVLLEVTNVALAWEPDKGDLHALQSLSPALRASMVGVFAKVLADAKEV
jgi:hypothetical protein